MSRRNDPGSTKSWSRPRGGRTLIPVTLLPEPPERLPLRLGGTALVATLCVAMLAWPVASARAADDPLPRADEGSGSWYPMPPLASPLTAHAAVPLVDPVRQEFLMLARDEIGPVGLYSVSFEEPTRWRRVEIEGDPPPAMSGATLDRERDRLLVFDGWNVWTLSLADHVWRRMPSRGVPPHVGKGSTVFDDVHDRLVVVGGYGEGGCPRQAANSPCRTGCPCYHNTVWTLTLADTAEWQRWDAAGTAPAGRIGHALVHDAKRNRIVLFGGLTGAGETADSWVLELDASKAVWTRLTTTGEMPARYTWLSAFHDVARDRALFVGSVDALHELDLAAASWTRTAIPGPETVPDDVIVMYDPGHRGLLAFHDGGALWAATVDPPIPWTKVVQGLPARAAGAVAYDTRARRMYVFGGYAANGTERALTASVVVRDLGAGTSWAELPVAGTGPSPRAHAVAAFDAPRSRLIVFGGADATGPLDDTWALELAGAPAWRRLDLGAPRPAARTQHAAALDREGALHVFGGAGAGGAPLADLWRLDLDGTPRWTALEPAGVLPARFGASLVFDSRRERLLLFGGRGAARHYPETWSLDLPAADAWRQVSLWGYPGPRVFHSAGYDSVFDRMLVFGTDTALVWPGAWALELAAQPPHWGQVGPAAGPDRAHAAMVVESRTGRLVVYGGATKATAYAQPRSDTWELYWGVDRTTPAFASLVSARCEDGVVRVEWFAEEAGPLVDVERARAGGAWTPLTRAAPDGRGFVIVEDGDVEPGARYGYRLAFGGGRWGETWIDVPAALGFRLRSIAPSPATGRITVELALGVASRVALEVFDATGRRVLARRTATLAAGTHVEALDVAALPGGVYWLRASDGVRRDAKRFAIAR